MQTATPKKIAHLLLLDSLGGVEHWYIDLAKHGFFDTDAHTVFAIGNTKAQDVINKLSSFVRVESIPVASLRETITFFVQQRKYLQSFDVVYNHAYYRSLKVLLLFRLFTKAKVITHNHSAAYRSIKHKKHTFFASIARKLIASFSHQKVAVSQVAAIDLFGTTQKVKIISCYLHQYSTIVPKAITARKQGDALRLVHIGRFYHSDYFFNAKNQAFLIDVLYWLQQKGVPFQMTFCGGGDVTFLKEKMNFLDIDAASVRFVSYANPFELLAQQDIFLFPSQHEGYGLSLVEAQLIGTYSIVSENIPKEAILDAARVCVLPTALSDAKAWAEEIKGFVPRQYEKINLPPYQTHIDDLRSLF